MMMSQQWIAGTNMPGYMPEEIPEVFETQDEAKRWVIQEIKRDEDDAETEEEAEELAHFAEEVNLERGEFSRMMGNRVYWVSWE
jgi:hypothetical protein